MRRRRSSSQHRGGPVALIVLALVLSVLSVTGPAAGVVEPIMGTADQSLADYDSRTGTVAPTSTQLSRASALGASVRWNRFGTPQSLMKGNGYLASGLSNDPATAARSFLRTNASLFRLTVAQVDALALYNVSPLAQGGGHAVLFRQVFPYAGGGKLPAAADGIVTVGVAAGKVAYVSSSLVPGAADKTTQAATLSPLTAWRNAARRVGGTGTLALANGSTPTQDPRTGWTVFQINGYAQQQQVRLGALPKPDGSVRPVFEANVVNVTGGTAQAWTSFVDAVTGAVLVQRNQVDNATENGAFQGVITATDCGPRHPFNVDADTKQIVVTASAAIATNDIVLKLYGPGGNVVASQDTGTSPEAITYSPTAGVPPGIYNVEVCPFNPPTVPFTEPGNYAGTFTASDAVAPTPVAYPPKWRYFLANPPLDYNATGDTRRTGCWVLQVDGTTVPNCNTPPGALNNLAARGPWDYDFRTNTPTFTTSGNAAETAEAWTSPLTPGPVGQRPVKQNRVYSDPFTDAWNNNRCNPANLVPGGNDILASVTHLFATHNRLHDWSYFLGFTEANYNMQDTNFGLTAPGPFPAGREGDPEIGNAQAGAITGGAPSYLGRDNANQITLQDGVPGITNQYLFQPIAGAFYAPCVDGDYDNSVVGHEYNHAISNRMVGGPDGNINGFQGGSMGESWGDQVALEYLFEHGYSQGTSPAVEGAYVTGNPNTGIRNYALDKNPLQYGDLGYDVTGPEVHADGEPWSAVMWDLRAALMQKYNAGFPSGDQALQTRCSQGVTTAQPPQPPLPASQCPGNRRWVQLLFDAYLLQQSNTSMLDARDAMLAADLMRDAADPQWTGNQSTIWNTFAKRGFGFAASTNTTEDDQPVAMYDSPFATEGTLRIVAQDFSTAARAPVEGKVYVGRYEARVTPFMDTDPSTQLPSSRQMVPGTYELFFRAAGYGLTRFTATVTAGQTMNRQLHLSPNLASQARGATIDGASPGSVNTTMLIDDTEATNYAARNQALGVNVTRPFVNVNLAGTTPQMVRSVRVSALLRPDDPAQDENPDMPDDESGSRFTALRQFALETCTESPTSDCSSLLPAGPGSPYTRIFTSAANAFPSVQPRPLAPDLTLRNFDVPDTAATHLRLVVLHNQCTGTPGYQGEQDNDPLNATDCDTASDRGQSVRAAELEAFAFDPSTAPPGDPVVLTTVSGPATASAGDTVAYTLSYTNFGPQPSAGAQLTDTLPAGLTLVSAPGSDFVSADGRTVRWDLGTVPVNFTGTVQLTAKVGTVPPILVEGELPWVLAQTVQFTGQLTYSPPSAGITVVDPALP